MNKAILVIDMPHSCDECPLFNGYYSDMCCRGLNNRGIDYPYPKDFRQDWCPLKYMPVRDDGIYLLEHSKGYQKGWNDCIKYLRGE